MGGYLTGDLVGISDLKDPSLWKAAVAEALGTFLLVFVAVGSCVGGGEGKVAIALTFGLTVASIAQAIGHVSGCHINPAVSLGLVAAGKMGVIKMGIYIGCQCGGALVGSVLLDVLIPEKLRGNELGKSIPSILDPERGEFLRYLVAVIVELIITMVLVLTVLGATDENRTDVKGSAPLAIGLSITACHLFAIPLTGSSMNPARSFGPLIMGFNAKTDLKTFWIYWLGPLGGGAAAGVLYQFVFRAAGLYYRTAPAMQTASYAPSYAATTQPSYQNNEDNDAA